MRIVEFAAIQLFTEKAPSLPVMAKREPTVCPRGAGSQLCLGRRRWICVRPKDLKASAVFLLVNVTVRETIREG